MAINYLLWFAGLGRTHYKLWEYCDNIPVISGQFSKLNIVVELQMGFSNSVVLIFHLISY